jgi:hypothetical protein
MLLRHVPRDISRVIRGALGLPRKTYWQRRRGFVYLREVRILVSDLARDAQSMLDVGSNGCPYLDWFDGIPRRVSIDPHLPYSSEKVEPIKADFLTYKFSERFDVCLCLQVLEHIPDAAAFAQRLLASARWHVIISVPYKWAASRSPNHVHDPVDEAKLATWFGRSPTHSQIARERRGTERIICHYDVREPRSTAPVALLAQPVYAG